ncbi:MAG: ABC transporter permease [Firmicutes bacterium]|nr:ABC transporter permease [Bacillota bacterium]
MILRMAIRNINRHRMRSILSFLAIALGVLVVILTKSMVDGLVDSVTRNSVELTSGHVRITQREYRPKERLLSLNYPIDGFSGEGIGPMVETLRQEPMAVTVSPRIKFGAMAVKDDDTVSMIGLGVEPEVEMKLANLDRYLHAGRFIKPGAREVAMGSKLLNKLGLKVGDRATLLFSDAFGSMQGYSFDIVGELRSGLELLDGHLVYLPLDTAQGILNMPDMVTEILIKTRHEGQTKKLHGQIEAILSEHNSLDYYEAVPWYDQSELLSYISMAKVIYNLVYFFILGLASFVVINTMIMIVNERTREIGMLAALGLRPRQILRLFMLEGTLLGVTGSALGTIFGGFIARTLSITGIPYEGIESIGAEFLMTPTIYPQFSLGILAFAFVAGLIITAIAVYIPARGAARLDPTEALRTS